MMPSPRRPGIRLQDLPPTPISRKPYGVAPKRIPLWRAILTAQVVACTVVGLLGTVIVWLILR